MNILGILSFIFFQQSFCKVDTINVKQTDTTIEVFISTDSPQYKAYMLHNPERIVIKIKNAVSYLPGEIGALCLPITKIKTSQYAPPPNPVTKIVIGLEKSLVYSVSQVKEGIKVTIDTTEKKAAEIEYQGSNKCDNALASLSEQTIGVGDIISISVPGVEEIGEKEILVGSTNNIFLPLAGKIQVENLTTTQLEIAIAKALSPYVRDAKVFVSIKESAQNKVCIYGEVIKPGVYRFQDGYTLGETVNLAEGTTREANLDRLIVKRANGEAFVTSMKKAQNEFAQPFDEIYVTRYRDIIVIGEVEYPGVFTPTSSKVMLSEVLDHTWVVMRNASLTKVKIISSTGSKTVKFKKASEVELSPGDVVVISRKRNIFAESFDFFMRMVPLATLAVVIYWHYQ